MGFLYTTHSPRNPLLQSLVARGEVVRTVALGDPLPDLTDCLAFYGNLFDEIKHWRQLIDLKHQLKCQNVPYVFWNRDAPWDVGMKRHNRIAMRLIRPVDIYLTHSMQGAQDFGGIAHYFPNAAQPVYYQGTDLVALRDESSYQFDVSFFGSFGNRKDRNARERWQFLVALEEGLRRRIPGVRFKTIDTSETTLALAEQLSFIRSSKINLSVGAMCDLPGNPSWGLPERVFGIPAAGGYLLTERRQNLDLTFRNPPASFSCVDDCVSKIEDALSDFSVMRRCAEALHAEVLAGHTYLQRAQYFLEMLRSFQNIHSV